MKRIITIVLLLVNFFVYAQEKNGPVIKDFGPVYKIKNPDLLLKNDQKYKVIFDVYTNPAEAGKTNPLITTVARFLNMHAQTGVPAKNFDIVLVLHGKATPAALDEKAFKDHFNKTNPDEKLLKVLKKAGVKIYVCGQSLIYRGFKEKELSRNVEMSLSALTALVYYQSQGYSLITFN